MIEKKEVRKVEEGSSSSIEPGGQYKLSSITEKLDITDRIGRENVIDTTSLSIFRSQFNMKVYR